MPSSNELQKCKRRINFNWVEEARAKNEVLSRFINFFKYKEKSVHKFCMRIQTLKIR